MLASLRSLACSIHRLPHSLRSLPRGTVKFITMCSRCNRIQWEQTRFASPLETCPNHANGIWNVNRNKFLFWCLIHLGKGIIWFWKMLLIGAARPNTPECLNALESKSVLCDKLMDKQINKRCVSSPVFHRPLGCSFCFFARTARTAHSLYSTLLCYACFTCPSVHGLAHLLRSLPCGTVEILEYMITL